MKKLPTFQRKCKYNKCENVISYKEWQNRVNRGKFCSRKCLGLYITSKRNINKIRVSCKLCANIFDIWPYKFRPDGKYYCSVKCSNNVEEKKAYLKKIGKLKIGQPSQLKGRKRPNLSGENNYRWIKNRTIVMEKHRIRGTIDWKKWRETVFKRDKYKCADCGKGGYLEPHHIIPIKSDWDNIFNIRNGITLCRPCHQKTMGKELELTKKYFLLLPTQV